MTWASISNYLYESLNKYHKNIKLTVEKSPSKFLDTRSLINNGIYETQVYREEIDTNALEF